jgi:hypothetical protein
MTIGKDTRVFKIIRTNKMSIENDINILGGLSFTGLLCYDFFPLNKASHHNMMIIVSDACTINVS